MICTSVIHKLCFCGKIVAFEMSSGDKGDFIDMWMINTTIKTNLIKLIWMLASFKSR